LSELALFTPRNWISAASRSITRGSSVSGAFLGDEPQPNKPATAATNIIGKTVWL
jgi:hypothetical protein